MTSGSYHHAQKGPWGLVCYGLAAGFLLAVIYLPIRELQITYLVTALFVLLLGSSLGRLTVEDRGDHLAVWFGPFPLFRRYIRYEDIAEVKQGQTTFLEGWGIHWTPWKGWVWNIWGYACVVLRLKRGSLKIGTDDPEGLAAFLETRLPSMR